METMNNNHPWGDGAGFTPEPEPNPTQSGQAVFWEAPQQAPQNPEPRNFAFPTGGAELFFGLFALVASMMLCNFTIFGGFNLGFGIAMCASILCAVGYLLAAGGRLNVYSSLLLVISLVISAGFGRSDDAFVKFVMLVFLTVSVNLALCLIAGQNRRRPGGVGSLLDVPRTVFHMGYGQFPRAIGGLFGLLKVKGSIARGIGSVAIGLLIMLPLLGIVMGLLMDADAAFEGMMTMMPEVNFGELTVTVFFGILVFVVLYSRSVALAKRPKDEPVAMGRGRGLNAVTMNTALLGISGVYFLYLISQLAYFVGGFAGILPEEYTLAEYARRGFFEMAWLCAINMFIIVMAVTLVRKTDHRAPLSTRLLCLFIGLVTLFLVAAASAKMASYIGGYGLTRKRVMVQLIILFFGLMALTVSVSLFVKKPRYMPVLLIGALLIGGAAFWVDVDTVVASYNVTAYQHGYLKEMDVHYLGTLSSGAIPHIARLTEDQDPLVAEEAQRILLRRAEECEDFREWNYAEARAQSFLTREEAEAEDA